MDEVRFSLGGKVGRYQLTESLGSGTFGHVFKARDTFLRRDVAVKAPRTDADEGGAGLARFVAEARIQAHLEHANIVPIYDVFRHGNSPLMVMRFVYGTDLGKSIRKRGRPLEPIEALGFMRQVLNALEFAHRKGVIHQDLKPTNIQVTPAGEAIVLDMGAARMLGMETDPNERVMGTPAYISPEQVNGTFTDARSDIYCLGIIFYELVTGQHPFRDARSLKEMLLSHAEREAAFPHELNPSLPVAFGKAIMRAMRKDKDQRFRSCQEFAEALATSLGQDLGLSIGPDDVRWDPRMEIELPVRLRVSGTDEVLTARTANLSVDGLALSARTDLRIGTRVNVELTLHEGDDEEKVSAEGTLVWKRTDKKTDTAVIGVNFTRLSDTDRAHIALAVRDALVLGADAEDLGAVEESMDRTLLLPELEGSETVVLPPNRRT